MSSQSSIKQKKIGRVSELKSNKGKYKSDLQISNGCQISKASTNSYIKLILFSIISSLLISLNSYAASPSSVGDLASSTHTVSEDSANQIVVVTWTAATDDDGDLVGYSYIWDQNTTTDLDSVTPQQVGASTLTANSPTLVDGSYYFHIRSYDAANNKSSTTHLGPFVINTVPEVSTVYPTRIYNDIPNRITITGLRIMPGALIYLGTQQAATVSNHNYTQISALFPSGLASGWHDLRIVNPTGGEHTLTDALRVIVPAEDLTGINYNILNTTAGQVSGHTLNFSTNHEGIIKTMEVSFPSGFTVPSTPVGVALGLGAGDFSSVAAVEAAFGSSQSLSAEAGVGLQSIQIAQYKRFVVLGKNTTNTCVLDYSDPSSISVTEGPALTASAFYGCSIIPLSETSFMVVLGGNTTTTNIVNYSNLNNIEVSDGPDLNNEVYYGGHSLVLNDNLALIVCGNNSTSTEIVDFTDTLSPVATVGPNLSSQASSGSLSFIISESKAVILLGNNTKVVNVLNYTDTNNMTISQGPNLPEAAFVGATSTPISDTETLIVLGNNTKNTAIFKDTGGSLTVSSGPFLTALARDGAFIFTLPDNELLIAHGGGLTSSDIVNISDTSNITVTAGADLSAAVFSGSDMFNISEFKAFTILGNNVNTTNVYDYFQPSKIVYTVTNPILITSETFLSFELGLSTGGTASDTITNPETWGNYTIEIALRDSEGYAIDGPTEVSVSVNEPPLTGEVVYFPHVEVQNPYQTSLYIWNPSESSIKVDLLAYKPNGDQIGTTVRYDMTADSGTTIVLDNTTFGESLPLNGLFWIKILSDSTAIVADCNAVFTGIESQEEIVTFGQAPIGASLVLPYYDSSTSNETTLSIINSGTTSESVTVACYSANGVAYGSAHINIAAGEQNSQAISTLISESTNTYGWVSVSGSDTATLVAYSLIKNLSDNSLNGIALDTVSDLSNTQIVPFSAWYGTDIYTAFVVTNPDLETDATYSVTLYDKEGTEYTLSNVTAPAGNITTHVIDTSIIPEGYGWVKFTISSGKASVLSGILNFSNSDDNLIVVDHQNITATSTLTLDSVTGLSESDLYIAVTNISSSEATVDVKTYSSTGILVGNNRLTVQGNGILLLPSSAAMGTINSEYSYVKLVAQSQVVVTILVNANNKWYSREFKK